MLREFHAVCDQVRAKAEALFAGASGSHDWEHSLRVHRLCERIGQAEGADMAVLLTAAYLHDIGRCYQDTSNGAICHAEKGAEMAHAIVEALPLSNAQKENVIHCIRTHRFRGRHAPQTTEAKVLYDADKLDAIGAVGIARAFLFAGEVGARLHNPQAAVKNTLPYSRDDTGFREYQIKLRKINDRILTQEGKRLARERHEFMVRFFERFLQEHNGKR